MLGSLCLLLLVGAALADNVVLNQVVDQALQGLNAVISQSGKATVPLSDMYQEWPFKKHHISFTGHLHCWQGYAQNLATLKRTGDVILSTVGNRITLKVALGLGTLSAHYDNCQLKASHLFEVTQKLDTSVTSNSIEAQATLVKNGDQCTASLDYIRVADLGKIRIDTGSNIFHKLEDHILEWFAKLYHTEVVNQINQVLQDQASANFQKADFCKNIPH